MPLPLIRVLLVEDNATDVMVAQDELQRIWLLRKAINDLNAAESMELLIDKISKFKSKNKRNFYDLSRFIILKSTMKTVNEISPIFNFP